MVDVVRFRFECECGRKYLFEVKKGVFENPRIEASSLLEIVEAMKEQINTNISVKKIE